MSALSRMANRDHHQIRIEPGDTVVLASCLIPGNENAVYRVINGLSRWGATVVHKGIAKVHVSGHAPAGELLYLLNATKPRNFMPVHGEWRHLRAHAELAELTGVPPSTSCSPTTAWSSTSSTAWRGSSARCPCGYVYVDGLVVGDVCDAALKDRRILGEEGFITVVVVVDSYRQGRRAARSSSPAASATTPTRLRRRQAAVEEALAAAAGEGVGDAHPLQQIVRRVVGRWVDETYRRRPMIIPVVVEA